MAQTDAWRTFERLLCSTLQRVAGVVKEVGLSGIVTTTGRVGHLTSLGIDGFAGNRPEGVGLVVEAKRRKLPKWFLDAVVQISEAATTFERHPVLGFSLDSDFGRQQIVKNKDGTAKKVSGKSIPLVKDWAAVPLPYLAELLAARRMVAELTLGDVQLTAKFQRYLEGNLE